MAQDMTSFEQAVDQVIVDSERLHLVVNGNAVDEVVVEDGTTIPTVRKAMLDNLYFKTPPIPWEYGASTTVFNQLYEFKGDTGPQWWYAPAASKSNPVRMPADPSQSPNWRLYTDPAVMAKYYAKLNSPRFEGDPRVPTPPMDDKSESIANTEFVVDYVDSIFKAMEGMKVTVRSLVVKGLTELANTIVGGTLTLHGPVNGADSTARFRNLILTANTSTLTFAWSDPKHADWRSTELQPHEVSTHRVIADTITSGKPVANNNDVHFDGLGNNFFDYVYIRGNAMKAATEPTLQVDGTTSVHNLEISGTVTGWLPDFSNVNFVCKGINSRGKITTSQEIKAGKTITAPTFHARKVDFDLEEVDASSGTWTPNGKASMYVVHAKGNFTIGQWPGTSAKDKPYPFTAVIYVIQDAVGHNVTLHNKYAILSAKPVINNTANSVTLLQLTYCGVGDIVDVVIAQR